MSILILYDSFFGNTEQIAQAVGQALGSLGQVETLRINQVTPDRLAGSALVVMGSPTRAFRPSKGVTEFLKSIPANGLKGVKVAAFDTRMHVRDVNNALLTALVKIFGYAAGPIAKTLVKKGGSLVVPAEGFFVKGSEGPLKEGERERAAAWGRTIGKAI